MLSVKPSVPFEQTIDTVVDHGTDFYIKAKLTGLMSSKCTINLLRKSDDGLEDADIALHFNVRHDDDKFVVLNSRIGGDWGSEVREQRPLPTKDDDKFEMIISVDRVGFKVSVNGKEFTEFPHRVYYKDIKYIQIIGDIKVKQVQIRPPVKRFYEIANPRNKILEPLLRGLQVGDSIIVNGFLPVNSKGFKLNLIRNHFEDAGDDFNDVALHFNPRCNEEDKVIVMNDKIDGSWGGDERRIHGEAALEPGKSFQLIILVEAEAFRVVVNGHHVTDFPHRAPFDDVNKIYIKGDIVLEFVKYSI
ncbi:Galectin-4 [Halotydeus destructor]|nr:Galectin-4 [Halotydeus destructor]